MKRTTITATGLLAMLIVAPACWSEPILEELARIPLPAVKGRIDHLAIDSKRDLLFVAALGNATVEVIDLKAGNVVRSLSGFREPQGVLTLPSADRLVVTDGKADHATIIDTLKSVPVVQIPMPEDSDNVRLEINTGTVWVGAGTDQTSALLAVDPVSGKVANKIGLRGHPESFQIEQQGRRIFVNVPTAQVIQVLDRQERRPIAEWSVPAERNFPMALDEESHRLFVGTRMPARLIVYDIVTGRPVANMPAVGDTDDLFYDSQTHRLYVTGGEGSVQVFQRDGGDRYDLVETVPTRKGARTSLFVSEWRKLFIAVPREAQQEAEIRVYSVRQ